MTRQVDSYEFQALLFEFTRPIDRLIIYKKKYFGPPPAKSKNLNYDLVALLIKKFFVPNNRPHLHVQLSKQAAK